MYISSYQKHERRPKTTRVKNQVQAFQLLSVFGSVRGVTNQPQGLLKKSSVDGSELNIFDHDFLKGCKKPMKEVSLAIPVGPRGLRGCRKMARINLFQGVNGHVERRRRVDVMSPLEANIHGSAQCIAMELWLEGPESSLFHLRISGVLHLDIRGGKVLGIPLDPLAKGSGATQGNRSDWQ